MLATAYKEVGVIGRELRALRAEYGERPEWRIDTADAHGHSGDHALLEQQLGDVEARLFGQVVHDHRLAALERVPRL